LHGINLGLIAGDRRQNLETQFAQVPEQSEFTYSAREDALVRALCPVALRASLMRAAWRTALCAWRWRKAGSFLPHFSFVFSKRKLQKLCVGRWGPVSL